MVVHDLKKSEILGYHTFAKDSGWMNSIENFMGALFSLIKAPCVGAVYFVILDMVRKGEGAGFMYLAAYNLGVVLPVLVLGAAIAFGLNPEKVERFRKERRAAMRLVTGVTLIIIAVLMYAGVI